MLTHPGPPGAVIYIRLLVPLTFNNLPNKPFRKPEGVLCDVATVGKLVGVLDATLSDKLTRLNLVITIIGVHLGINDFILPALREISLNPDSILAVWPGCELNTSVDNILCLLPYPH